MIEAIVTPIALALVAALAGWRTGRGVSRHVHRFARRARGGWRVLRGRTVAVPEGGMCAPCLKLLKRGGCPVLCKRCDPVLSVIMGARLCDVE